MTGSGRRRSWRHESNNCVLFSNLFMTKSIEPMLSVPLLVFCMWISNTLKHENNIKHHWVLVTLRCTFTFVWIFQHQFPLTLDFMRNSIMNGSFAFVYNAAQSSVHAARIAAAMIFQFPNNSQNKSAQILQRSKQMDSKRMNASFAFVYNAAQASVHAARIAAAMIFQFPRFDHEVR